MYEIEVFFKNGVDSKFSCENYTVSENWLCLKESETVKFWYSRDEIKSFIAIKKEDKSENDNGGDGDGSS